MRIGAKTDQGKVREQNEDAYGYHDNLFVLADGMGGHRAGEIASAIAVDTILGMDLKIPLPERSLNEVVNQANQAILSAVARNPEQFGMGTTIAILYLAENYAHFTHIGDSRIYRYTNGSLIQLTDDHSLVAELVRNGSLTEAEARNHPKRNILTRALGAKEVLDIEVCKVPALIGDEFLLCSDGLTEVLDDVKIEAQLSQKDGPQVIVDRLITLANDLGGTDNITVILIEI
jgi:protein phosphatase